MYIYIVYILYIYIYIFIYIYISTDTCFVLPRTHQCGSRLTTREELKSPECSKYEVLSFAKICIYIYNIYYIYIDIDILCIMYTYVLCIYRKLKKLLQEHKYINNR